MEWLPGGKTRLQPQYWVPVIMARKANALGQGGALCDAPVLHRGIRPKWVSSSDLLLANFLPRFPYLPSLNSTPPIHNSLEQESLPPASREWELRTLPVLPSCCCITNYNRLHAWNNTRLLSHISVGWESPGVAQLGPLKGGNRDVSCGGGLIWMFELPSSLRLWPEFIFFP